MVEDRGERIWSLFAGCYCWYPWTPTISLHASSNLFPPLAAFYISSNSLVAAFWVARTRKAALPPQVSEWTTWYPSPGFLSYQLQPSRQYPFLLGLLSSGVWLLLWAPEMPAGAWWHPLLRIVNANLTELLETLQRKWRLERCHPVRYRFMDPLGNIRLLGHYVSFIL